MSRFWTSDTHFGHLNIISLCHRPFSGVDEMNEVMIERWNSVVKPADTVYHHGDVALGKIAETLPLIGRLNGHKILIPGNHDRIWSGEKEKSITRFTPEYQKVFQEIWPEQSFITVADRRVMLCHFPFEGDSQENDRHADKRPKDRGEPLIHGHIHEKRRVEGRMINVGVDVNDFYPVSEDEIVEWIGTL